MNERKADIHTKERMLFQKRNSIKLCPTSSMFCLLTDTDQCSCVGVAEFFEISHN